MKGLSLVILQVYSMFQNTLDGEIIIITVRLKGILFDIFLHFITGSFVRSKISEKMINHLEIASIALHKDSDEAKIQIQKEEGTFEGMIRKYYIFWLCLICELTRIINVTQ